MPLLIPQLCKKNVKKLTFVEEQNVAYAVSLALVAAFSGLML